MQRTIVISALLKQLQVGIVENGRLVEYYIEKNNQERFVGNIYKGRVEKVLPGMGAAFVNIGLEKNAFLFLADVDPQHRETLRKGDELLVQVAKEPAGTKGARITTNITLPGRYLVLLPFQAHIGISRQIAAEEERARLKELGRELLSKDMGVIVRTVAVGCEMEELQDDLAELLSEWERIENSWRRKNTHLVYQDHDLVYRVLRDLYVEDCTSIVVDCVKQKKRVETLLFELGVASPLPVELHEGKVPLFTALGLTRELHRARNNRVWLNCGGYLVFNQTEALLAIDVNTGKYVGSTDQQQTVVKTNLEAAEEIAHQLRLRNVGGIIVIDFIDMTDEANREAVLSRLEQSLKQDKTRTNLLGFTRLGLVELTRKKSRRLLSHLLEVDCPHCSGTGRVSADETIAFEIAEDIRSLAYESEVEAILVHCHPAIAGQLIGPGGSNLAALEEHTEKAIFVRGNEELERGNYQLDSGSLEIIKAKAYPVKVGERLKLTIAEPHAKQRLNGVARVDGFVVECLECRSLVGQTVEVEITELHKTCAIARLVESHG